MDNLLNEIKEIENSKIQYEKESQDYFEYRKGKTPVLISSPHGARHKRKGVWKEEDEYTSSIAMKLAERTGAHVIFVKNATSEDPNHVEENRYKEKIEEVVNKYRIKFLLDFHGADKSQDFRISVGIIDDNIERCSCPTFKEIIQKAFSGFQEEIFNVCGYSAKHPGRITNFARNKLGIEAAQFEINGKYRIIARRAESSKAKEGKEPTYKAKEEDVLEFIRIMERLIKDLNRKISEEFIFTVYPERLKTVVHLLNQKKAEVDSYMEAYIFRPYGIDIKNCLLDKNLIDTKKLMDFSFSTRQGGQPRAAIESYEKEKKALFEN